MAVLTAFWIYVTLSNVLYAHSMQASLGTMSSQHLFAPWQPRVLQHLFLYPILIGCVWASLHIGWQPDVEIRVQAVAADEYLVLRVINTMADGALAGADGIGLRNVRERLALQFGSRATFHAGAADASNWMAEIRMPSVRDALDSERVLRTGHAS
jgi:hypothetical protein